MSFKITGNGMPDGSENKIIREIKFNNSFDNIDDADVNILKFGDSTVWLRAFNIKPYTNTTGLTAIDGDSITVHVRPVLIGGGVMQLNIPGHLTHTVYTIGDSINGTLPRDIIVSNQYVDDAFVNGIHSSNNDDLSNRTADGLVYYGDAIDISASANKGYSSPTIISILDSTGVEDDINLNDYISPGSIMSISPVVIDNDPFYYYNLYNTVEIEFKNVDNTFPVDVSCCTGRYSNESAQTGFIQVSNEFVVSGISYNTKQKISFSNSEVMINGLEKTPECKVIRFKTIYGAAIVESYYTLRREWYSSGQGGGTSTNTGGNSSGCVTGDTVILTNQYGGEKISNLKITDTVLGFDTEGHLVNTPILNKYFAYEINMVYRIKFSDNTELKVTGNHPILCGNEYKNIEGIDGYSKLNIGDIVTSLSGNLSIVNIEQEFYDDPICVYNIYTELDNYIANNIVVACENPSALILGVNCFERMEGAFNPGSGAIKCVSGDTDILVSINGDTRKAKDIRKNDIIMSYDEDKQLVPVIVLNNYFAETTYSFNIYLDNDIILDVSENHPILCGNEYKNIGEMNGYSKLNIGDSVVTTDGTHKILNIKKVLYDNPVRVYNFYTGTDNFIANNVVVACENPDDLILGVNYFETPEGGNKMGGH